MGSSLRIHYHETEWSVLVRSGCIIVLHVEIASLNDTLVHLINGDDEADMIVCCAGWKNKSTVKFGPPTIALESSFAGYNLCGVTVSLQHVKPIVLGRKSTETLNLDQEQ